MTKQKLDQYRRKAEVYEKYRNYEYDGLHNAWAEQLRSIRGFPSRHHHSGESANAKELSWNYPGKGTEKNNKIELIKPLWLRRHCQVKSHHPCHGNSRRNRKRKVEESLFEEVMLRKNSQTQRERWAHKSMILNETPIYWTPRYLHWETLLLFSKIRGKFKVGKIWKFPHWRR